MVDKVAADLGFRAYEVRWLLPEKYFEIAATFAAGLLLDDNINNNNVREAIVRAFRRDKNIIQQHCARIVRRSRSFDRKEIRTSSGAQGPLYYI